MDEEGILSYLQHHHIPYQRYAHPPVFTVAQADAVTPPIPGAGSKNLLLVDPAADRILLLMTAGHKRVDFKHLSRLVGAPKGLRFAPETLLAEVLGVGPGAVTVLGLVNDGAARAELWIDSDLWQADALHCHPLVNTATLVIAPTDLERFFLLTGHPPHFVQVPGLST